MRKKQRKLRVGDKVRMNEAGHRNYPNNYSLNKTYTIEMSHYEGEGVCVYNDGGGRHGWIHEGMGVNNHFDLLIFKNIVGGKLV